MMGRDRLQNVTDWVGIVVSALASICNAVSGNAGGCLGFAAAACFAFSMHLGNVRCRNLREQLRRR